MINLDFSIGVSLYLFLAVNTLLALWLVARRQKDKDESIDQRFIWFCSICTYTYINTKDDAISLCPRCGSYNKKVIDKT